MVVNDFEFQFWMTFLVLLTPRLEIRREFIVGHHIEGVDRCAGLSVNSKKRDQNILAIKTAERIIKQSDTVRGLKFNQRVSRMRLVVDRDARGKFNADGQANAQELRFFDRWHKIEAFVLECAAQRL